MEMIKFGFGLIVVVRWISVIVKNVVMVMLFFVYVRCVDGFYVDNVIVCINMVCFVCYVG